MSTTTNNTQLDESKQKELDDLFVGHIKTILQQITQRFPENEPAKTLLGQLAILDFQPSLKRMFRNQWREITSNHREAIMNRNTEVVVKMFDDVPHEQIKMIGITHLLTSPDVEVETKDSIWEYTKVLTVISHMGTETQINKPSVESTQQQQQTQKPVPIAPPQTTAPASSSSSSSAKAAQPNMEQAMKTILDSMPKFVQTFNKVMNDDNGDNTFAKLAKQFMNPNQLQSGMAPNLMANLLEEKSGEQPSVMQQVQEQLGQPELDANDIVKKLQRLEKIEAIRAKRKR